MPEFRRVPVMQIEEPGLAIRMSMDDAKLNELAASMRELGLLNPLTLRARDGAFEIEAGHRRFLAARRLGWADVPALVYQPGEVAPEAAKLAENIYREDLSAAEEAVFFAELMERRSLDTDALAALLHQQRDYVEDRLRLLAGDEQIFAALQRRDINFSVARELNKLVPPLTRDAETGEPVGPDPELARHTAALRRMYLDCAIRDGTRARVVSEWVSRAKLELGLRIAPVPMPGPVTAVMAAPAPDFSCRMCGGSEGPWSIHPVNLHDHCWAHLDRILREAGR